jgi:membrane protease YdiL (CAAX protease family)
MVLVDAVLSALLNLTIFAAVPFLLYIGHERRHGRVGLVDIAERAGLALGERRYIGYSLAFALACISMLIIWPPPLEPLVRPGSGSRQFVGLGLGGPAIPIILVYGVVKTGFAEELLFRGLIAGSLSRRLPLVWANLSQALIFVIPHLILLFIMPELWMILPLIFIGDLFLGWVRIKSGSIIGPWLVHASVNVTMALSVAIRTAA